MKINQTSMKLLRILTILFFFSLGVSAQFVANNKRAADIYFQNKEYYAAAEFYKRALNISPDSTGFVVPYGFERDMDQQEEKREDYEYNVFQLATSLRLYKNYLDAEQWYAIAKNFSNPKYALSTFWYAECLRANQKFLEARAAFGDFLSKNTSDEQYRKLAMTEMASCSFALYEMRYPRLFSLQRLVNEINDKGSNYAPYLNGNDFFFTSSRPVGSSGKTEVLENKQGDSKVTKKESPFLNAIYQVEGDPLNEKVKITRAVDNPKNMESAAAAFHPGGKTMYMTRWDTKESKKVYHIYAATLVDGNWTAPKLLTSQVNVPGFNSMQPSVTKDGKFLLFSSDRPGGSGKYDLWYCPLRTDGSVGQGVNMGTMINTPEDEQAPYYNPITKKLLYSSTGRVGLGGFDFFETDGDFVEWSEPLNMGYPFNSSKDDLYFTSTDSLDRRGYISSDRASVCCLEIFQITREYLSIQGSILDCETTKPLAGALVTISDSTNQYRVTTDNTGRYSFKVTSNRKLKLSVEKDNYFTKTVTYNYDHLAKVDTLFNPELCLQPFKIDKPIVLENVLYEFDSDQLTEESKLILDNLYTIMIDNTNIEIELSAHTDNIGSPIYNLDLSQRRAKSCVDYLVGKGISASRMTSAGYGLTRPVAPNKLKNGKDNPKGRALNRRTEFKVTKK